MNKEQNTSGFFTPAETIALSKAHPNTLKNWRPYLKDTTLIRKTGSGHGARYAYAPEFVVLMMARTFNEGDRKSERSYAGGKPPADVIEKALPLLLSGKAAELVAVEIHADVRELEWLGVGRVDADRIAEVFAMSAEKEVEADE